MLGAAFVFLMKDEMSPRLQKMLLGFASGVMVAASVWSLLIPAMEMVADGLWFVQAKGHTRGNSIVILESDGLFYMFHGDVTYCDAALKANKLSIVFEDKEEARQTLNRVRQFVATHPTVYLSTHCPEGYENLQLRRVMKL